MKKIVILTLIFFFGVFLSTHRKFRVKEEREEIEHGEGYERYDEPAKFQEYLSGIKIRKGETQSGYAPSYQFLEHQKARLQSARRKTSSVGGRTQSNNGVLEWKERGPANVPGRTRALLVDPDDATRNTWYAGSASGGIWKTTNGGNSWTWITPALPNLATTSMAMAESNHNIIYAGTGEGFGNLDGVTGHGVFKSINRGQDWSLIDSTVVFGNINRLIIDPSTENTVVVVANSGIYRTIDGGSNWTKTFSGIYPVQDIDATPGNFLIQYAAEYHTGVLKSVDGGQTWQPSNVGMNPNGRVEIAVSPVSTGRVFASCQGILSGNNSDMFMSDDAGVTWSLVNLSLSGKTVDFLSGGGSAQGWYDNTIVCDPYNQNVVYVGGVGIYQVKVGTGSSVVDNWAIDEFNTKTFLLLQTFSNVPYGNGRLDVGPTKPRITVEIRFGPGITQKAHRFTVPAGSTSGVPDDSYSYIDYVPVNFEAWDVTSNPNRQLMVSFRDQNTNGAFNLLPSYYDPANPLINSREYVYIQDITYNSTVPSTAVTKAGGHKTSLIYNIFPALAANFTPPWDGQQTGTVQISFTGIAKLNATTVSAADPYSDYDGKNRTSVIHPDHHNLVAIPIDNVAKTYRLLNANDGGVYISNTSVAPGTSQGNWTLASTGYNTGQFYGADKRPGADEYIGGLQDNGTQKSPVGVSASSTSLYKSVFGGDGFEVIWNNNDAKKIIGGFYSNNFLRSTDGGITWQPAISGFPISNGGADPNEFPFISRLAVSKNNPEVLFTPGHSGVWKSTNFGGQWKLTSTPSNAEFTSYLDVDVSAANANIVWEGAGMGSPLNIFVSTDNGVTFNATSNYPDATLGALTKLATHPTEPNTAYALFSFAHSPKILRTTNLGQTWQDISGFGSGNTSVNGFPDVAVYSLYVRPDNPNIIWAGTEIGIVESLDNGVSWALLTDFPAVSVWDMKGQDDQVVIATHGRGIWTAKIAALQIGIQNPVISAYGTSPQSKFVMRVHLPEIYDSTQILVNAKKVGSITTNSIGDYIVKLSNVAAGSVNLEVIGFKNAAPAHSAITARQISLLSYQSKYYNYFSDVSHFVSHGFVFTGLSGATHSTLQSAHPYPGSTNAISILRQPIIITNSHPFFYYSDVALVEHGPAGSVFGEPAFTDYVVVEATRDGLTWVPLADGYNSAADPDWLTAFNGNQSGKVSMEASHSINLTNALAVGDTVLFRFRLSSDNDGITGWGWSVNELTIQQVPTGIEPAGLPLQAEVFPNPATRGQFFVKYYLPLASKVTINVNDVTGRILGSYPLGNRNAGGYTQEISQELTPGSYFLQIQTDHGQLTRKVIVKTD